jgi:hypothetical protein
VSVPNEAGDGMAKLRFSFDTWKSAGVAPSTIELPILGTVDKKEAASRFHPKSQLVQRKGSDIEKAATSRSERRGL